MRNGHPVGRIAAILNRTHNEFHGDHAGFFGFFACEDDPATATALVDAAAGALRAFGCDEILGPTNPSIHDDCGLLVEGNDLPASVSMPWNPAHYAALLEAAGFVANRTLYAYTLGLHRGVPPRIARVADRLRQRSKNLAIRSFDLARLDDELRLTHRLYNVTLDRNSGFYPIALDDLLASADDLKAFADPDFLIFAELDGVPVGFMLTLPNFHEILRRVRRVPRWLRLPAILWHLKTKPVRSVRQVILGVDPAHRDRGLAALLCADMVRRTQKKADVAECSWVESNNTEVIPVIELMGGVRNKTYHLYRRAI
jgi:GNAT superfamily N-acetyltransferase